jgi:hypothetical protein
MDVFKLRDRLIKDYSRTINDYPDDLIQKSLYTAIGRTWWEQGRAIQAAAQYLGFRRVGSAIRARFTAAIVAASEETSWNGTGSG